MFFISSMRYIIWRLLYTLYETHANIADFFAHRIGRSPRVADALFGWGMLETVFQWNMRGRRGSPLLEAARVALHARAIARAIERRE